MPTRSYYFPSDFEHLEKILESESKPLSEEELKYFRERDIPPITAAGILPIFLGVSPRIIYSVRKRPYKYYRQFKIKKKSGSYRLINTPRTYLKSIQWWILDNILNRIKLDQNIFGFIIGRSAVQNAQHHMGAGHLLNVDIKDFFPSIDQGRVFSVFREIGYSETVSEMLSELCTLDNSLPQGAPTSPAIANLALKKLDKSLSDLAREKSLIYSRYADDLTFSSKDTVIGQEVVGRIEELLHQGGLAINREKTRFSGRGNRMEITGVVINSVLQPSRTWRKYVRARIHRLSNERRLVRRDAGFLNGISAVSRQFPESQNMAALSESAKSVLAAKRHTVFGLGDRPVLPKRLSLGEATVLAALYPGRTNKQISILTGLSETAVKTRLSRSFSKIGVRNRIGAYRWAREYI